VVLIADPATIDTIEYAYLEGEEGVFTEQRVGFEVDGIEVKGRLDFAAKAIDWRGMYYNPGARRIEPDADRDRPDDDRLGRAGAQEKHGAGARHVDPDL
jgi:hypothetical protein